MFYFKIVVKKLGGKSVERIPIMDIREYEKNIETLQNFCDIISDQDDEHQVLMKNWVVVRLVSMVEYNLKSFLTHIIDELDISPNNILLEDSILIKLDVLENFQSTHYTKGKMIVAHLDYLNAGKIYAIMSRINHVDYFKWYGEITENTENIFDLFNELYKLRNDVIHNLMDVEKPIDELKTTIEAFRLISYHLITFTTINLIIFEKKWVDSEILQLIQANLPDLPNFESFLQKFKKITKKYRAEYAPKKSYFKNN